MKKLILRILVTVGVLGAAWAGYRFFKQMPQRQQQVATAPVRQSDVVIRAFSRGELRAVRSATLTAPNLFTTVQVTKLAPLGSFAKEKDLIVEFDDSERRSSLEEALLAVDQVDEQIRKAQADLDMRNNQDQVELLRAKFNVRRAELEVQRNELLSAIDAKKNLLNLEEARRRLKQLESDIKSRQEQALAELATYQEQRKKSLIDVSRERERIAQSKLLSPMSGLVAVRQNRTGMYFPGMQIPDIREGDTLQPGIPVADVLDLSELEVVAKVGELDRANLHEGQDVILQLDAVPDKKFHGQIKSMSGTASANIWAGDPAKKFDVVFSINMKELLSELGAKPEQIRRVLETAAQNAKKGTPPPPPTMADAGMLGAVGGAPAGGAPQGGGMQTLQMGPAAPGGAAGAVTGGAMGGGGGPGRGGMMRSGGDLSPQDQEKFRQAMQKALGGKNPQDLSPEERQKLFAKVRETFGGGKPGGPATPGEAGGPRPGVRTQIDNSAEMLRLARLEAAGEETNPDRAKAKLPLPPEEDTQLDVLLRPGLLADVEIIVEKIPNAIHIPSQAVFEKEGRPLVYVKTGNRFEPRFIKLAKRSESTMVIAEGLKPGEIVALADPNAKKGDNKKNGKSGTGLPAVSGGKGGK